MTRTPRNAELRNDGHARCMRQRQEREGGTVGYPLGVEGLACEGRPPDQTGVQGVDSRLFVLARGRDRDFRMGVIEHDAINSRAA